MTLNKKQEKYLFVGTSIFVLLVLFVVVFICPNFYMQYRVVLHPEPIIDVTDDEREIIKIILILNCLIRLLYTEYPNRRHNGSGLFMIFLCRQQRKRVLLSLY